MRRALVTLGWLALVPGFVAGQSASLAYQVAAVDGAGRDQIGFSWLGPWAYGDNFVHVAVGDVLTRVGLPADEPERVTSVYGEWHARVSVAKVLGRSVRFGPVADAVVATELSFAGDGFLAHAAGLGVDWGFRGFSLARTSVYVRNDVAHAGTTWQVFGAFLRPVDLGVPLLGVVFVDGFGREGPFAPRASITGDVFADVGVLLGARRAQAYVGLGLSAARVFEAGRSWRTTPRVTLKLRG